MLMSAEVMFFIGPFPSKKRQFFVLVRCIYIACKCREDWQSACHKLSHLTEFQPRAVQLQHRAVESDLFKERRGEIRKGEKKERDMTYFTAHQVWQCVS